MANFRRDYSRLVVNKEVVIVMKDEQRKKVMLQDLSANGAAIITDGPFDEKEKVRLNIDLPLFFEQPVSLDATVTWSKQLENNLWRIGLNFGIHRLQLPEAGSSDKIIIMNFFNWVSRFKKLFISLLVILVLFLLVRTALSIRTINLEGVVVGPRGQSRALINGDFYYEGDKVDHITIKGINEDSVELSFGNRGKILKLNKKFLYLKK